MKTKNKSGFTLIEMIVVLAVIGTLLGVVIAQFGGATESALAAKCEANLKNLATAAHTCAQAEANGHFPAAGSFWYVAFSHKGSGSISYPRRIGWISGSEKDSKNNESKVSFSPIAFWDEKKPDADGSAFYAITNGARGEMWREVKSQTCYQCPIHARAMRKKTGMLPSWSYCMNREFGIQDDDRGSGWWGQTLTGITIRKIIDKKRNKYKDFHPDHSKVLMFAEFQAIDINQAGYDHVKAELRPGIDQSDAILDYRKKECIGFNHQTEKRRLSGHVAFADGHVEKLNCPKSQGLSRQELTRALCRGHSISYNGKTGGYTDNTTDDTSD